MLALLMSAWLLQASADPAVDGCLAGGGAAGRMGVSQGQGVRRHELAGGTLPVRLLVTILKVTAADGGTARIYADDRNLTVALREGHAQVVSGRNVWIEADPDVEVRYCLRVVS